MKAARNSLECIVEVRFTNLVEEIVNTHTHEVLLGMTAEWD